MKQQYINLLKLKDQYYGIAKGFTFLDRILYHSEFLNNNSSKNIITIYNYKEDKYIDIKCDNDEFENYLHRMYIKYLHQEYFSQLKTYNGMIKILNQTFTSYFNFGDANIFNKLRELLFEVFLMLANPKNEYSYDAFITLVSDKLDFYKLGLFKLFIPVFITQLVNQGYIKLDNNVMSFAEEFFNFVMDLTSTNLASFDSNQTENKFPRYDLNSVVEKLPLYVNNYKSFLNSQGAIDNYSNIKNAELILRFIQQDKKKFFLDLDLEKQKISMNEYCFHVIVMSFFPKDVIASGYKHIFRIIDINRFL